MDCVLINSNGQLITSVSLDQPTEFIYLPDQKSLSTTDITKPSEVVMSTIRYKLSGTIKKEVLIPIYIECPLVEAEKEPHGNE